MDKRVLFVFIVLAAINSIIFADVYDDSKVYKISGGENHTLVLTKDNKLWGCGDNLYYQLGIGDTQTDQKLLVQVYGPNDPNYSEYLIDINDMDAGWKHSLAADSNGFAWAWGDNYYGQIGNNSQYDPEEIPVKVHSGEQNNSDYLVDITAVAAGRSGSHSLAVDCNENALAWGNNGRGQLGIGSDEDEALEPNYVVAVGGGGRLNNIIAVSAGEDSSIALGKIDPCDSSCAGYVYTWGDNSDGQLGNDSNDSYSDTPVRVLSGEQDPCDDNSFLCKIVAIDSGWDHLIALEEYDPCGLSDPNGDPNYGIGYVYAWGSNNSNYDYSDYGGQLGIGSEGGYSKVPVKVLAGEQQSSNGYLQNIKAVSAGEAHSIALDFFGNVWCWGDNKQGQLGNGTDAPCSLTPVKVVGENGIGYLENIVAISAGYWHNIAIDVNGVIWTWGMGDSGALAAGELWDGYEMVDCNVPQKIGVVRNITDDTFDFSINKAIDDASNEAVLELSNATFHENVVIDNNNVTIRSTDPQDDSIVSTTKIDVLYTVIFQTPAIEIDDSNVVLNGLTITTETNEAKGIRCYDSSVDIINSIIENCDEDGIYCEDSNSNIINCIIENNSGRGIWCRNNSESTITNCVIEDNGNSGVEGLHNLESTITNCVIENNGNHGVYCHGSSSGSTIVDKCIIKNNNGTGIQNQTNLGGSITNNIISENMDCGIYLDSNGETQIKNNWIFGNGADDSGDGIYIKSSYPTPAVVRNNTLVNNVDYGIRADYAVDANISNCVIWDNDDGQLYKCSASFSCIENGDANNGNINNDPCFVDADSNDFHLRYESGCIDIGDSNGIDANEVDIDGEGRILNAKTALRVDIGADEYYYSKADFNNDEVINFIDYAMLAAVWDMNSNDADYNDVFDLYDDDVIDNDDLALLADEWLWQPGWAAEYPVGVMMAGAAAGGGSMELLPESSSEKIAIEAEPGIFIDSILLEKWLIDMWKTDKDFHSSITMGQLKDLIEAMK